MGQVSIHGGVSRRSVLGGGLALGALAVTGLSACGSSGGGAGGGAFKAGMTHYDVVVHNAPFHIAEAAGYYEDEGVDMSHVALGGGAEIIRAMTGDMGFLHAGTLSAMVGYTKARPDLRMIASVYNAASVDFIVPVDSPIESLSDIANAKLGVSEPGSNSNYVGQKSIDTSGESAKLVTVGDSNAAWTVASSGVVDVAWSAAPLLNKLVEDGEARVAWRGSDAVPQWSDTCIIATEDTIDQNSDTIMSWLAAVNRAMKLISEDVDQASNLYAKRMKLTPAVAESALTNVPEGTWSLKIDTAAIEQVVQAGVDTGQLDSAIDLDSYVVDLVPKNAV